jgi:hypothetical protein
MTHCGHSSLWLRDPILSVMYYLLFPVPRLGGSTTAVNAAAAFVVPALPDDGDCPRHVCKHFRSVALRRSDWAESIAYLVALHWAVGG